MTVFLVYPDNIAGIWDEIAGPLLAKAIERGGTHAPADVLAALVDGRAQLWLQGDREACVVTEIVSYPRMRACRIWLAGAKGRGNWGAFHDAIIPWARVKACKEIAIEGRGGWLRVFSAMRPIGVLMRMPT